MVSTHSTPPVVSESPEWIRAKEVTARFGIRRSTLDKLRKSGAIRSTNLKEPGESYGVRIYNVASIQDHIAKSEKRESEAELSGGGAVR